MIKTRQDKLRQPRKQEVEIRGNELIVSPNAKTKTSEQLGVTGGHPNSSRVPLSEGDAVVSPKNLLRAKKIAKEQSPEVSRLNKELENRNLTPLARKSIERRLNNLRKEYNPILLAEQMERMKNGGVEVNSDGTPVAGDGFLAKAASFTAKNAGLIGLAGGALALAPTLFNLGKGIFGKKEKLNPNDFQNPNEDQAISLMANRRFNADPLLESNESAAASANYNMRNAGIGGGAYAANRIGIQNARMRGDSQAYATQQNMNNQYRAEEASMRGAMGAKRAETNLVVSDLNSRNKSAKGNYSATGMSQLGQWGQVQAQMAGQKEMDKMRMDKMGEYWDMFSNRLGIEKQVVPGTPSPVPESFNLNPLSPWENQMAGRNLNNN
jgi:hypothetical protein